MPEAAWHPDPLGRYELRYWDGDQWTEHVANDGRQEVDPEPIVTTSAETGSTDVASGSDGSDGSDGVTGDTDGADATADAAVDPGGADATLDSSGADATVDWSGADATVDAEAGIGAESVLADANDLSTAAATPDDDAQASAAGDDPARFPPPSMPPAGATAGAAVAVDTTPDSDDPPAAAAATAATAADDTTTSADRDTGALPSGDLGADGIGGGLLDDPQYAERSGERVVLQNPRLLKVTLGRDVMIKRGSMIAYQGDMTFNYESEGGGLGGLIKRAVSTDNAKMARVSGSGDLFLADNADEVHMLRLAGGGLVVNGPNLLAFEDGMTFQTRSLGNAGMIAGGVFVTDVSGHGWVAVTCHGTPVRLDTDAPTFVDAQSAVAWSAELQVDLNVQKLSIKGMRSGEMAQLAFRGRGFVLVQASEGPTVPSHSHG